VEWFKVQALSSSPTTAKEREREIGAGWGWLRLCPSPLVGGDPLLSRGRGSRWLSTPAPEQLVLISGHVLLQFEKLGYSQPWIQVPTSLVYLTGKESHWCIKALLLPALCVHMDFTLFETQGWDQDEVREALREGPEFK
jgi:hypothetical protein